MTYPQIRRTRYGAVRATLRRSPYARTWALAQRLRAAAETPFEYVARGQPLPAAGLQLLGAAGAAAGRAARRWTRFLFDTKEGYCQHFSGAMALLLRMGGVPARVATGFSPGGFSQRRDAWIVRDTDAHAWVEAWFDQLGWVTFDPTPASTPARSQIAALEASPPATAGGAEADDGPAAGGAGGTASRGRGGRAAPTCSSTRRPAASDADGERGRAAASPWWPWALFGGGRGRCCCRRRRAGARRRRRLARPGAAASARSPSSRPRCAAPAARCRRHDAAPARAAARRHARRRRLPARPQRLPLRARRGDAHAGAAPRPPPSARPGPRAGRRLRALWALPPRPR